MRSPTFDLPVETLNSLETMRPAKYHKTNWSKRKLSRMLAEMPVGTMMTKMGYGTIIVSKKQRKTVFRMKES